MFKDYDLRLTACVTITFCLSVQVHYCTSPAEASQWWFLAAKHSLYTLLAQSFCLFASGSLFLIFVCQCAYTISSFFFVTLFLEENKSRSFNQIQSDEDKRKSCSHYISLKTRLWIRL